MKTTLMFFLLLIGVFLFVGCAATGAANVANVTGKQHGNVIDYGNGVYYFDCISSDFANTLSAFRKDHPTWAITAIAGNDTGGYGYTLGYFIVVNKPAE